MSSIARRRFLQNGLGLGGALLLGSCGGGSNDAPGSPAPSPTPTPSGCPDQFAGGQQMGAAAFGIAVPWALASFAAVWVLLLPLLLVLMKYRVTKL